MNVLASGYSLDALNIVVRDHERDGSLDVELFYADDVFDADYRFSDALRHVFTLVETALDTPDTSLGEIDMLSDDEYARLDEFQTGTPVEFPRHMTVDRLAVGVPGGRTAVRFAGGTLTYAEFDAAVNHFAGRLRGAAVQRDECVAVIVPRSAELLVAIHGVLRSGAAYVPIDPEYPELRVRTLLEESDARVIVAGDEFAGLADQLGLVRIEPVVVPGAPVASSASPEDLAYVIYTSGSTGRPKGVMVEHRSVINRLNWMQRSHPARRYGCDPAQDTDDVRRVGLGADVVGDGGRVGRAARTGGRARSPKDRRRGGGLPVTVMHFVPSMLGPFLDQLEADPTAVPAVSSLHTVFCSGEVLSPALVERFNRAFQNGGRQAPRLVNLYGPTEATVDVSCYKCPSAGPVESVPIGRPIDNITLLVLDERGNRCPVGVPGELNIAGVGVGRGYRGRDEETAAAFVANERVPGGRRYRTGDLARWRADGNLDYLGRIDDQVKVRGNRVSLGEVQTVMASCPGVRSAAVIDEQSATHGTHLIGYYVADFVSVDQLAEYLAQRLPGYMVPTSFVELDAVPLTASGKVDRRALPRPGATERSAVAPRTEAEAALVDVFGSVLGVESVGVHDNFFTVGGDSILALVVRSEAEKRGIALDVEQLFARPTVAELAESISQGVTPAADSGVTEPFALLPLIDRASLADAEDAFPATALALGMLYHSIERADSTVYKDVFRYRVALPWREAEFTQAFDRLVERHPALRSSFELTGHSVPVQVVRRSVPRAFDVVYGADDADVVAYTSGRQSQTYDFGSLYSLRAFVRGDTVDLVFAFHHAILDGWSVASLIRELLADYLVQVGVDVRPVDAGVHSATMLAEYVRLEKEVRDSPVAQQFWRRALEGARATSLGSYVAHEPPAAVDPDVTVLIPRWLQEAASDLAVSRGLPLRSLLLAAHCLVLRRLTGDTDVTTGLVTHGRPGRFGAETAAGLFLNTIPIRLDDSPVSWLDAVEHIARFERASHPFRRYPLQAMQTEAGHPVFETAFNFVNYHLFAELAGATGVELLEFDAREQTNFALLTTAGIDPRTGRLSLRVNGDRAKVTASQAAEFAASFVRVLTAIVRSPERPVDLAADELTARDVVQLVSEQAARTPEATALVSDHTSWSYADLESAAERIAASLLADGMPPAARVGVMLDRSPDMIATVLGVMKAGAAVVPLDVSYPRARIDVMIERARPFRVISEGAEVRALMETPAAVTLPVIDPNEAAYVLFTSGSTGEPKGVTMPHRALANLVAWQNRRASGVVGGSTLQFAPLSFDVSFQEIFSTLCGGGSLRLVGEERRRDLPALVRLVTDERIERIFLPFVALQAFAEAATVVATSPMSLRAVISSGEQLRVTPEIRRLCCGESRCRPGESVRPHRDPCRGELHHDKVTRQLPGAAADRHRDRRRHDRAAGFRAAPGAGRRQG